eukprot:2420151-Pleurochrysis_carterae.AAC.4
MGADELKNPFVVCKVPVAKHQETASVLCAGDSVEKLHGLERLRSRGASAQRERVHLGARQERCEPHERPAPVAAGAKQESAAAGHQQHARDAHKVLGAVVKQRDAQF